MTPEQQRIISDALEDPDELTPWEWDFINSLADLESFEELSEKQAESLFAIGEKF